MLKIYCALVVTPTANLLRTGQFHAILNVNTMFFVNSEVTNVSPCSTLTATTEAAATTSIAETPASDQDTTGTVVHSVLTQSTVADNITDSNEVTVNNGGLETSQGTALTQRFSEPTFASEAQSQSSPPQPVLSTAVTPGDITLPSGPNLPPGGLALPPGVILPPGVTLSPGGIPLPPSVTMPPSGIPLPPGIPVSNPADILFNQIMGSLNSYNDTTDLVS